MIGTTARRTTTRKGPLASMPALHDPGRWLGPALRCKTSRRDRDRDPESQGCGGGKIAMKCAHSSLAMCIFHFEFNGRPARPTK